MALLVALVLLGPIAPSLAHPLASTFTEPTTHEEVDVPWDLTQPAQRAVLHVTIDTPGPTGLPTVAVALETEAGDPVMYAVVDDRELTVTDGFEEDGTTPRERVPAPGTVGEGWSRVDVLVDGDTYTLSFEGHPTVTARTFTTASDVVLGDPDDVPGGPSGDQEERRIERVRLLPLEASTTGFAAPLADVPWQTAADKEREVETRDHDGRQGDGVLAVDARVRDTTVQVPPRVAYAYQPLPNDADRYLAEASTRPWAASVLRNDGVPDHQAVLAGLSGPHEDPMVHWAVVMALVDSPGTSPAPVPGYWGLFLIGPDGSRTQVSPTWDPFDPGWHDLTLLADEDADTLTLQVDHSGDAMAFSFDDLGDAERVAIGDVFRDHLHYSGAGEAFYDDATVIAPWPP